LRPLFGVFHLTFHRCEGSVCVPWWLCVMSTSKSQPSHSMVCQAAEILRSGGLVVFPTETVYGIAASAASDKGVEALRAFKGRPAHQPFTIHLPDPASATRYIGTPHPLVDRFIRKNFPGPVTLVADVAQSWVDKQMPAMGIPAHARRWVFHQNTVGLRCPDAPMTQEILAAVGQPVVASSANARGQPPPRNAQEAVVAVGDAAQMVVDGGACRFAKPSTVVRIGQHQGVATLLVERVGVYDERQIRQRMRWTMLLVCSGNTCRSPMAEAIAKQVLAGQWQVPVDHLPRVDIHIHSAGVFAGAGLDASPEAINEMAGQGLDLSGHRSKPLTAQMVREAQVCYCMTRAHWQAVVQMVPEAKDKILLMDPGGDVEDPIGLGPADYSRCAQVIRRQMTQRLKEQHP